MIDAHENRKRIIRKARRKQTLEYYLIDNEISKIF
jgi:hypothetical protein